MKKRRDGLGEARVAAPCRKVRAHVFHLLDGRLSPASNRALRHHLEECPKCFSRYEFSKILRQLIKNKVLAERCPSTLLLKVRNALANYPAPSRAKFRES